MMELVEVGGKLTLETTALSFLLKYPQLCRLAESGRARKEEEEYYYLIVSSLRDRVRNATEPSSRRIIVAVTPESNKAEHCLTSIQLLIGERAHKSMVAHFRSSNSAWIASDLSFLGSLAVEFGIERALITIGSFHTVLE